MTLFSYINVQVILSGHFNTAIWQGEENRSDTMYMYCNCIEWVFILHWFYLIHEPLHVHLVLLLGVWLEGVRLWGLWRLGWRLQV